MKTFYFSILFSFNLFAQWQPLIPYPTMNNIVYIKAWSDSEYIICTSPDLSPAGFEIFTTSNAGKTWNSIYKYEGTYLDEAFFLNRQLGWAISHYPQRRLWKTTNGGYEWTASLPDSNLTSIYFLDENTGFLSSPWSVSKTTDGGEHWNLLYSDSLGGFGDLSVVNENFIAAASGFIRITTDGGNTWSAYKDSVLTDGFNGVYFLDSLTGFAIDYHEIFFKTTDGGNSWTNVINWNNSYCYYPGAASYNSTCVIPFTCYENSAALYITTNKGETWTNKSVEVSVRSVSFINDSTFLLAGRNGFMYKTTDYGLTFTVIGKGRTHGVTGIFFTGKGYGYLNGSALLHTFDGGETFIQIPSPPMSQIAAIGDSIILGFGNNKILRSTNKGVEWSEIIISPPPGIMWEFSFPEGVTGYFTSNNGIYKTTDAGASWMQISSLRQRGISFADKENGFVMNEYIYKTTDGGSNWQQQAYIYYGSIAMLNNELGAGGFHEIFYTYDGGIHWTQSVIYGTSPNGELWDIEVFNHNGSIIGYGYFFDTGRLYYSTDSLRTWQKDYEFPLMWSDEFDKIPYLFYDGEALWAGTVQGYILKRENFEGLLTSINDGTEIRISEFQLEQNYPNPFNPSTTITYSIPIAGKVRLKVYDALGTEVRKLVDEEKASGNYKVDFNAEGLASGIYFYQLRANDVLITKKMILMR